jgi:hypothetical protein
MANAPQRWARVPPGLACNWPGLPTYWVPVLERHPEGAERLPGYVWLDSTGKVLHVEAARLESGHGPPVSSS